MWFVSRGFVVSSPRSLDHCRVYIDRRVLFIVSQADVLRGREEERLVNISAKMQTDGCLIYAARA